MGTGSCTEREVDFVGIGLTAPIGCPETLILRRGEMTWVFGILAGGMLWEAWVQGRNAFELYQDKDPSWQTAMVGSATLLVCALAIFLVGVMEVDK